MTLTINSNRGESQLFQIAERINPKRSFLFVSSVLGRHIPVRPRDHLAAVRVLVDQVPDHILDGPVFVMGFAETAVGFGAAVARQISKRRADQSTWYQSTTRHPVDELFWAGFSEVHSHAIDHYVMRPESSFLRGVPITLVLVDDETTTGNTFAALSGALRKKGLPIGRVVLLTLTDWSGGDAVQVVSGAVQGAPVDAYSLMQGRWEWARNDTAISSEVPVWTGSKRTLCWRPDRSTDPLVRAPRISIPMGETHGLDHLADRVRSTDQGAPVLVIGTGEHVWGPMLLAERLEQEGAEVRLVSTTRSPIIQGEVIQHKLTFMDHFGIGVPMYLHNVPSHPEAHVIIMTETDASSVCSEIRSHLGRGLIVDGTAKVREFGRT